MSRRLPERPTIKEFFDAANRYQENKYEEDEVGVAILPNGQAFVYPVPHQRAYDIDTIRREWAAEGFFDLRMDLGTFALSQTHAYDKLGLNPNKQTH